MADTTSSSLDNMLSTYYNRVFIERLEPQLHLYEWAQKRPIPKNEGKTVQFTQWNTVNPASGKLTEGTPPTSFSLSSRKVNATVAQYGRVTKITDFVDMTAISPIVEEAVNMLADSAAKTYERVLQMAIWRTDLGLTAQMNAGDTVLSALMSAQLSGSNFNGGTKWGFAVVFATSCTRLSAVNKNSPTVSAQLSRISISKVVAKLRDLNAKPMMAGAFFGYTDDFALRDLMVSDPNGWTNAYQYADPQMILKGEAGMIAGCRLFRSSFVPKYRVNAHSCSLTFIFGKDAFGCTEIDGAAKIIVKPMENVYDKTDTLNQYATVGYKWTAAAVTLNPSAGRILITHTRAL